MGRKGKERRSRAEISIEEEKDSFSEEGLGSAVGEKPKSTRKTRRRARGRTESKVSIAESKEEGLEKGSAGRRPPSRMKDIRLSKAIQSQDIKEILTRLSNNFSVEAKVFDLVEIYRERFEKEVDLTARFSIYLDAIKDSDALVVLIPLGSVVFGSEKLEAGLVVKKTDADGTVKYSITYVNSTGLSLPSEIEAAIIEKLG
ncbi:MAG: hypothetical protein RLN62_04105, partial [Rickettsiales bacterium]